MVQEKKTSKKKTFDNATLPLYFILVLFISICFRIKVTPIRFL